MVPRLLEDATRDGLVMDIVMISITAWIAVMMAGTVVDVMLKHHGAQYADALIRMEVGVEQHAHQQPQARQQA